MPMKMNEMIERYRKLSTPVVYDILIKWDIQTKRYLVIYVASQ